LLFGWKKRAGDEIRTHDNNVGNVVLYQLSYTRMEMLFCIGIVGVTSGRSDKKQYRGNWANSQGSVAANESPKTHWFPSGFPVGILQSI
jgi:hypothetical protein